MSRSQRAWMESCAPANAGQRAGLKERASLERRSLLSAVSFTQRLITFLVAGTLLLAVAPAVSLAKAPSSHAKSQTRQKKPPSAQMHAGVVLAFGSGYTSHGSPAVRALQRRLARAGDSPGPIDGRYGPLTERAVTRFQAAHGLQVDGIAGPITIAALRRPSRIELYPGAGYAGPAATEVRALQRHLARAGDSPGPIDGRYGPLTERAVTRFQAAHGLRVDGIAGPRTLADLNSRRPASHRSAPARRAHPARPRPHTHHHRQPTHTPATRTVAPVSHPTSSPRFVVLLGLAVLIVVLGLFATLRHRRRRAKHDPDLPVTTTDGAPAEDPSGTPPTTTPAPPAAELDTADAAFRHARILEQEGDQMGAMAAYLRATRRGHAGAACNLGVLLQEQGKLSAAAAAYRRADALGHGVAAYNLGLLLERSGDQPGAVACYRRADHRGDGGGAFKLAGMLVNQGDAVNALRFYKRAAALGPDEVTELARAAEAELQPRVQTPTPARTGGGHNGART
jgi:peptidoglycan hydrolase-like protein with peptidoglycan-binding domain